MALIKCSECKQRISDTAESCPHCGAPKAVQQVKTAPTPKKPMSTKQKVLVYSAQALFAAWIVSSCVGDDKATSSKTAVNTVLEGLASTEPKRVRDIVQYTWPKALQACPGIEKNSDALTFAGAQSNFESFDDPGMQQVNIKYQVDGTRGRMNSIGARTEMCYYTIKNGGGDLHITKNSCQAICLDRPVGDFDGGPELRLPLDSTTGPLQQGACLPGELQCLGAAAVSKQSAQCKAAIERQASGPVEWTDGVFESTFTRFAWANKTKTHITLLGDKATAQNAFGATLNIIYGCTVAADGATVLQAEIQAGKL
jgi:hypothetical protein